MDNRKQDNGGQAVIKRDALVIRVPLKILPMVLEGAWATNALSVRYKITNVQEFANDLIRELNREDEQGSTRIHKMFDKAIEEAIDQGALGIEEHEQQEV